MNKKYGGWEGGGVLTDRLYMPGRPGNNQAEIMFFNGKSIFIRLYS